MRACYWALLISPFCASSSPLLPPASRESLSAATLGEWRLTGGALSEDAQVYALWKEHVLFKTGVTMDRATHHNQLTALV